MPKTQPYDVADYLTDDETILSYLEEALDTGEPRLIAKAIAAVARARSRTMPPTAPDQSALDALSDILQQGETADIGTAFRALQALGLKLTPSLRHTSPLAA